MINYNKFLIYIYKGKFNLLILLILFKFFNEINEFKFKK